MKNKAVAKIIGSYLYTEKANDIDILILSDKKKNIDIHYFTFDEFDKMNSKQMLKYSTFFIVDKCQMMKIKLSKVMKNNLISCIDSQVIQHAIELNDYKMNATIYRAMLFCMNGFKHFSKKEMQMIEQLYNDNKVIQQQIFKSWKKFIKRKRSRKIGYYCYDKDENYKELTKEEYRHEKEDSNYINIGTDDKPTIMWMSDEAKQLWKSKHSNNK